MRLDPDRIWPTVFAGDPELGLGEDEEAVRGWLRKGVPRERIIGLPRSENFWGPAGATGPCGPCSELNYDRGEELGCGEPDCAPGCDRCERFLEFWNLVFMEYDLDAEGKLTPLPNQNVDTGLGLERGAMLLQEADSIFDTDGFRLIMDWIEAESGVGYGSTPAATEGTPGAQRPRAGNDVPDRRGSRALQRGPRLRPAPADPTRRRPGPTDRARGGLPPPRRSSSGRSVRGTPRSSSMRR